MASIMNFVEETEHRTKQLVTAHNRRFFHFENARADVKELSMLYGEPTISNHQSIEGVKYYSWGTINWTRKTIRTQQETAEKIFNNTRGEFCVVVMEAYMAGILRMTVSNAGEVVDKQVFTEASS